MRKLALLSFAALGLSTPAIAADSARDRYECHLWAIEQTGVDPTTLQPARQARVVIPAKPKITGNEEVAGGVLLGATLGGAAGATVGRSGEVAVLGAMTGLVKGLGAQKREEQEARRQAASVEQAERQAALLNQKNEAVDQAYRDYLRARTACLNGR